MPGKLGSRRACLQRLLRPLAHVYLAQATHAGTLWQACALSHPLPASRLLCIVARAQAPLLSGVQAEKYGGRIGYEAAPAAQPAQPAAAAPPSASAGGAPDTGAGSTGGAASDGAPAGPGTPGEAKAPPGAPGAPARAGATEPPHARTASPAPSQAPARAPAQQAVAFEERDQVDRLQALRLGEPVDFVLVPGGPGRRPRATQARAPTSAARTAVPCAPCHPSARAAPGPVACAWGAQCAGRAAVQAGRAGEGRGANGVGLSIRLRAPRGRAGGQGGACG